MLPSIFIEMKSIINIITLYEHEAWHWMLPEFDHRVVELIFL